MIEYSDYLSVNISYIDGQSRCDKSQKSTDMTDSSNRRQSYKEPHFGCCHVIHAELCVSYQGPLRVPNVDNLFLFCDVTDITDHGGEVIFSLFLPTETEYKNSILHAKEPTLCIHVSGLMTIKQFSDKKNSQVSFFLKSSFFSQFEKNSRP